MAKSYFEVRCDVHGKPEAGDRGNLKRVNVGAPRNKREKQSGCPICRKLASN